MIRKGMTLEQVKAAKPTADYDPRYGATTGFWTTDMFIEAVYRSLSQAPRAPARQPERAHGIAMKRAIAGTVGVMLALAAIGVGAQAPQGAGQPAAPPTPRAQSPIDLTGTWVSVVTEDWRWRMMTPPKGDYPSIPLNDAARKIADAWDPARDTAAGEQCRSYGGAAIMRVPGRVRISWENDTTLRVDTEAGTQTRRFVFGRPAQAAGEKTWQGTSVANWQAAGGGGRRGDGASRGGSLRVVTTGMRTGYLQKNGVPYSENAVVTEYFNRTNEPNGDQWLVVTTVVQDPQYLSSRFARSSHFKKVAATDATWRPTACEAS